MKEGLGGMSPNQSTLMKFNAGIDLSKAIDQAWKLIFKYENFHVNMDGTTTNRRSELNDRLDAIRVLANNKWPIYTNTNSWGASGWSGYAGLSGLSGFSSSVGSTTSISHLVQPITPYVNMFRQPPWYERWYKACKDVPLAVWTYLKWVYKTGKWSL